MNGAPHQVVVMPSGSSGEGQPQQQQMYQSYQPQQQQQQQYMMQQQYPSQAQIQPMQPMQQVITFPLQSLISRAFADKPGSSVWRHGRRGCLTYSNNQTARFSSIACVCSVFFVLTVYSFVLLFSRLCAVFFLSQVTLLLSKVNIV